ncbi:MAG: RNA 2',3'-cyclic phosphodiesterase [Acidobacteria bacterium]|nr:RNA 2',3'-cyclic phosphodiesterase [Acidobacteriota bacterium]
MRTFIAIPIPESCLEILAQIQRQLQTSGAPVRWTNIHSIHLTLKFLGETDPGLIAEMAQSLEALGRQIRKFHLQLSGVGAFPEEKNPRIVWCGIGGDTDVLTELQEGVETVCAGCGFPPEDRPFRPHLTLGRVKGRRDLKPLIDRLAQGCTLQCRYTADRFNIYKSVLKPEGAVYTVVEKIALS